MTISQTDFSDASAASTLQTALGRIEPGDLEHLRRYATLKTYPAGTVLCREGQTEHIFYVLHSGEVKITQHLSDAEDRLVAVRGPGEFFGEMALIDKSPRSATVTAASEVAVVEITAEVFTRVLENSPTLAMLLLQNAQSVLRNHMQHQIAELRQKNRALEQAYRELQHAQTELVRTERMKRDLEIAAQVQRSILPTAFPQMHGLAFAARAQPAREIGGDFYDIFPLGEKHLGLLIADVSDKSIHAAIFMAVARSLFLTEARRSLSPRQVVMTVNDLLLDISSTDDMFVTAFYGVLHMDDRRLTYVRAGHDKPLLQRADGRQEVLDGGGRFLGILEGLQVEERTAALEPGDRLVMYSDGVPDATNAAGANYTGLRLRSLVMQQRAVEAETLADTIFRDVLAFQGDAPQFDDITLLVAAID